jgi:hypothetical protein
MVPRAVSKGFRKPMGITIQSYPQDAGAAIGQKSRYVLLVETVVSLTDDRNQKKKPNHFWSEWQDSNLRPPRPERGALPG